MFFNKTRVNCNGFLKVLLQKVVNNERTVLYYMGQLKLVRNVLFGWSIRIYGLQIIESNKIIETCKLYFPEIKIKRIDKTKRGHYYVLDIFIPVYFDLEKGKMLLKLI